MITFEYIFSKTKNFFRPRKPYELSPPELLRKCHQDKAVEPNVTTLLKKSRCKDDIFSDLCMQYTRYNYLKFVKDKFKVPDNLEDNSPWARYISAYLIATFHFFPLVLNTGSSYCPDKVIHSLAERYVAELLLPDTALKQLDGKGMLSIDEAAKLLNVPPHILKIRLFANKKK